MAGIPRSKLKSSLIIVRALWDEDAKVWVASSTDIPGLATEARTLEQLGRKILVMIEELIELNGLDIDLPEIPIHIMAERTTRIANPRAS